MLKSVVRSASRFAGLRLFAGDGDSPEEREAEWRKVHQPFELKYHQRENMRWDDEVFFGQWDEVFGAFCGLQCSQFTAGAKLLDLGCGSRPVIDWFDGGEKFYLDPLLDQYRKIPQMAEYWLRLPPENLFSAPAEELIASLESECDLVNCWNVLDHTYDWRWILLNIWRYAKPEGVVCLGTDIAPHGPGHPGINDAKFFWSFIESHFTVLKREEDCVNREVALLLRPSAK